MQDPKSQDLYYPGSYTILLLLEILVKIIPQNIIWEPSLVAHAFSPRQRGADLCENEASPVYITQFQVNCVQRDSVSKKKKIVI